MLHSTAEQNAHALQKSIMLGTSDAKTTELLVIKLGMPLQPFQKDYEVCQHWVMHSWMKLVWEKAHHL
jgi:hypothetical protein